MYGGRTLFRTRPLRILWVSALPVGSAIAAWLTYGPGEDWFVSYFFIGFFVLGIFALAEALTDFLALDADKLRFRKTFRSVQFTKADIELVTWTKGGGASIKLRSGRWVMIPDMGYDSAGITNSIRAWLKSH